MMQIAERGQNPGLVCSVSDVVQAPEEACTDGGIGAQSRTDEVEAPLAIRILDLLPTL